MERKSALETRQILGSNINRLLKSRNMTVADLSKALNVSYTAAADWVKGRAFPRLDKVEAMADLFQVEKTDLIEDSAEHDLRKMGDKIKKSREKLGWSQDELAIRLGYKSRSSINKMELGIQSVPLSKIKELARTLGVSVEYLLEDTSDFSRPSKEDKEIQPIGERISQKLREKHLSLRDLEKQTGIHRGTLSKYISGKMEPKTASLHKIAQALEADPQWLLGWTVPSDEVKDRAGTYYQERRYIEVVYPAIFEKEGRFYNITFPDFPDAFTYGEGYLEAYKSAKEALELVLIERIVQQQGLPDPTDPASIKTDDASFTTLICVEFDSDQLDNDTKRAAEAFQGDDR